MTPLDPAIVDVLDTWNTIAVTEVNAGRLASNHCILACKTLAVTLNELGYNVTVHPVQTIVTNRAARHLMADGIPFEQWPEHAWSVGTDRRPNDGGYPGHLILTINQHLIDPTANQFRRPGRLQLPDIIITDADEFNRTGHTAATGPDGTTIEWFNDPTLGNQHRNSPNWKRDWRHYHHTLTVAQRATNTPQTDPKPTQNEPTRPQKP